MTLNCLVMGAAGRDFHDFLVCLAPRPELRVRAFTGTQIPFIERRAFPRELAGENYDGDIPIFPEEELPALIARFRIDVVFFAYSDIEHEAVMHKASLVQSCGAAFTLLGPKQTQLVSSRPVIAVTAVRTGCGKSPISRAIASHLAGRGERVVVVRHPMPYGDLRFQAVERFERPSDLDRHQCTLEEREEYAPYLSLGIVVFAGIDYRRILAQAEIEANVIVWDGGNNDYAFLRPGLTIVVADALRPGHETRYFPGETNVRLADAIVINKVDRAEPGAVETVRSNVMRLNPRAAILEGDLVIAVDDAPAIAGRRVLVVEDGPTLTHGGMPHGAGWLAAERYRAGSLVDPRTIASGSIAEAFARHPHIGPVLPALGYRPGQVAELARVITASGAELVIDASPAQITRTLALPMPSVQVRYDFQQRSGRSLFELVDDLLGQSR